MSTEGSTEVGDVQRPLRVDARNNRDRLVAAARAALTTEGSAASLNKIARSAGVGIGTLYRHFPTRDALVEAVYGAELDDLAASAHALLNELPPDVALRRWVVRYAVFTATKRGMQDTLNAGLAAGKIPTSSTRERITGAIAPILSAGATQGSLRADVDPDDVTSLLLGAFLATAANTSDATTGRLLNLIIDALRPLRQ